MAALFQVDEIEPLVGALVGGIDVDGGPTAEQERVLGSIVSNLWKRSDLKLSAVTPLSPGEAAAALVRPDARLRFCEILVALELCRHPQSENQVSEVEAYVSALRVNQVEFQVIRESLEKGADETSKDLERFYGGILPEISEVSLRDNYLRLTEPDHDLAWAAKCPNRSQRVWPGRSGGAVVVGVCTA